MEITDSTHEPLKIREGDTNPQYKMITEKEASEGEKKCEDVVRAPGLGVRHLQVGMMALCATMLYMVRSSMGPAILAMTDVRHANTTHIEVYGWSEEIRGVILSSFFWGYTLMQIPAGVMGKKFGGKPLLLVALLVNGVLCLVTPALAKIGDWVAVCAVRTVMGLTQACFMPSYHTILGQWVAPEERTRLSTLSYAGIQIGTILAMPICGILSQSALGWKLIYYVMGGMTLVTSVLWWRFTANCPAEHRLIKQDEVKYLETSLQSSGKETSITIPWRKILTSVPLYAICVAHIGANWTFVFFLVEIPTYMKNGLNIDLASSSTLSALPFLGQWIVSLSSSFVCEYIYNKKILSLTSTRKLFNSIGCVGIALGFLVLSFLYSDQKVLGVIVLIFTVSIFGTICSGFILNHIDLSPNFGGLMFSITNCVANLVAILVPLLTGVILGDNPSDIGRWRVVFLTSGGLVVATDLVYRLFTTSDLQDWNSPASCHAHGYSAGKLNNEEGVREESRYEFAAE